MKPGDVISEYLAWREHNPLELYRHVGGTMNVIDKIQALHEAATPGEWEALTSSCFNVGYVRAPLGKKGENICGEMAADNAELIAALRNAWPALKEYMDAMQYYIEHQHYINYDDSGWNKYKEAKAKLEGEG